MRKASALAFALLAVSLLMTGCAKKEAPAIESGLGAEIEQDLAELDSLDQELDLSELDSIDDELSEIDTLFG